MPKIKTKRKDTFIDMAPMVDLAFLLITFFMLIIQFAPEEAITVTTPASVDKTEVQVDAPDAKADSLTSEVLAISADKQGRVFIGIQIAGNDTIRAMWLENLISETPALAKAMQEQPNLRREFVLQPQIGVSVKELPSFLGKKVRERKEIIESPDFEGIPMDTSDNQLGKYVKTARLAYLQYSTDQGDPSLIDVIVKADVETPYPVIRDIINTLRKQRVNRFHLVTNKEDFPSDFKKYKAYGIDEIKEAREASAAKKGGEEDAEN
mgnify:CR=1 FL=1